MPSFWPAGDLNAVNGVKTSNGDGEQVAKPRRKWGSARTTITLLAIMVALVAASFLYIVNQQAHLQDTRQDAREMRRARQALMAVDRSVLVSMAYASDTAPSVAFGRAASALEAFGTDKLPKTVTRDNQTVPVKAALASLNTAWDDIVAQLEAGNTAGAHETYKMRQVDRDMAAFLTAFANELDAKELEYAATETRIEVTTWVSLLGQIATGILSILAFFFAARRGAKASRAHESAVRNANATREQVVRLFDMTDMLQSATDHSDANAVLRATGAELLPGLGGALYVFNNSRDRLTLSTQWNIAEGEQLPDSIGLHQCWALKRGKSHTNRPKSHKLCCEHHHGAGHCLEIPMIARGEILGLLQIYCEQDNAEQKLADVTSIGTALADAMSLALANIALRDKLRSQALRDPLTGLYNRRYMEDTLQRVVRLSERERSDLSVIMIDLDHFKRLNDQYGHAKGDAVLRDTASLIISQLRESDVACRYGGEELTIILPQCGLAMAVAKAERLRASIEGLSEPSGAQISASFGVACIPATSSSSQDLMAAADAALYQAKQDGRNRVIAAPIIATDAELEEAKKADASTSEAEQFRTALVAAE